MNRAWLLVAIASACGPSASMDPGAADLSPARDLSTGFDQSMAFDQSTLFDLSIDQSSALDLSTVFDQSIPVDQSTVVDYATAPDLAAARDLSTAPDLASPPDLARTNVVIDFDDLATSVYVTDQYAPYARFSSSAGNDVWTVPTSGIVSFSPPNCVCSGAIGAAYASCTPDLYVDFPRTADGLTFSVASYTTGVVAQLDVYSGGSLAAQLPVDIQGSMIGQTVDLSSYAPVTRVELVAITAPYGVGFDELRFSAVP